MTNPYQILEVEETSPISLIKANYRNLSAKYHPDKVGDNNENSNKKFLEITEAFRQIKLEIKSLYTFLGIDAENGGDDIRAAYFRKKEEISVGLKKGLSNAISDEQKLKKAYNLIVSELIDDNNNSQNW
ncbi:MAG: J domain-containing protein [Rickettsiales bacterium]|nr:J domain-containing protein [Rickettsiales bacterium]